MCRDPQEWQHFQKVLFCLMAEARLPCCCMCLLPGQTQNLYKGQTAVESFISCSCFKRTIFNYFSFVVFVLFVYNGGGEGDIGNDIEHRFIVLGKQKAVMDNLLRAVSAVPKVIYIAMDFSMLHYEL